MRLLPLLTKQLRLLGIRLDDKLKFNLHVSKSVKFINIA